MGDDVGAEICRFAPQDGAAVRLAHSDPPVWDFRRSEAPDGRQFVFSRAGTGAMPAIWVADADGGNRCTHAHPYLTSDNGHVIFNADPYYSVPQVYAAKVPQGFLESLD